MSSPSIHKAGVQRQIPRRGTLCPSRCPCKDSKNDSKQPIQRYIDHRVLQTKTLSDSVPGLAVIREVIRAAEGLWLYARLMLDEIETLPSATLIQRHLRSIPLGLTQLCIQLSRSKETSLTATNLKFVKLSLLEARSRVGTEVAKRVRWLASEIMIKSMRTCTFDVIASLQQKHFPHEDASRAFKQFIR